MPDLQSIDTALSSLIAEPALLKLLKDLHTEALTEPSYHSTDSQPQAAALDRFVALDPDKCALVYLLLRASGARNVVEAGTSFGLSTIWLALAVGQNSKNSSGPGKVIATENEPTKASRALQYWKQAGTDVEPFIELRQGDLRETLKKDLPAEVDFLLLDIWSPLALPTLKIVQPHFKVGAMVVVDNNIASKSGYRDLFSYLENPNSGFRGTSAPYEGGLYVAVYVGV